MRGISEERLEEIKIKSSIPNAISVINTILDECQELSPWLPIDKNTPVGRWLLVSDKYRLFIGRYNTERSSWEDDYGDFTDPIYWQELPSFPEQQETPK